LESTTQEPLHRRPTLDGASIGLKLVLLLCGVVLFTAGGLGTWGFLSYRAALLGQQLRELEVLAGSAEARLSQLARSIESQVAALAREDDFRAAVRLSLLGDTERQRPKLLSELVDLADTDEDFASVQLYDVSGVAVAGIVQDGTGLRTELIHVRFPAAPPALEQARRLPEGHSRVVGPFVRTGEDGKPTLRLEIGAPVFDDAGSRVGVVHVEYDLRADMAAIQAEAGRQLGPLGFELVFADPDGVTFGDAMAALPAQAQLELRKMLLASSRASGSQVMGSGQSAFGVAVAALGYSSPDPGRFGIVALAAPRAHLLAMAHETVAAGVVAAVAFTLIALALALAFARSLLNPLDQLLGAVLRFGAGEPVGDLPTRRSDEVGRLATAFGDMARQVDERSQALAREIEERERTEDALRDKARRLEISEARYRQLYDSIAVGVCMIAADGRIQSANPAYVSLLGYPSEGALREAEFGRDLWVGPEDCDAYLRQVRQEGELSGIEVRLRRRDGRIVWVLENIRAIWHEGGEVTGYESIVVDITERKHAEYARRASELRFRRLSDSNLIGVVFGSVATGEISEANSYVLRMLDYEERDLPLALNKVLPECDDVLVRAEDTRGLDRPTAPFEKLLRARDGSTVPALVNVTVVDPRRDEFVAAIVDRSDEARHRRQLSELKEFFRFILDASPTRIAYVDAAERIVFFNEPYLRWYGVSTESVRGRPLRDVIGEAAYRAAEPEIRRVLAGEARRFEATATRDGRDRHFDIAYVPHSDEHGSVLGFISVAHDVTELRELEARLRQSHKLEALGELTGGIAHDFNNLLSVVIGNLQLCDRQLAAADRGRRPLEAALKAATRGAELTRRLLSFARLQPMQRCALDVGRHLAEMRDTLLRSLGANVRVEVDVEDGLWPADTDPGQLENALLNLAINARDAMAGNGTLTLSASNVTVDGGDAAAGEQLAPGEYVSLRVIDDGPGMSPDVLARAFEPFFSTKPVGKGSGLGLAMVYGFARQSGGGVRLLSAPGEGTTVELLLRRAAAAASGPAPAEPARAPGGSETVLVVEDDDDVRVTTVAVLADLGYRVFDARDARSALAVLEREPQVDLLLTDIVLRGGMRGTDLAVEATRRRPRLRVIYATGFADARGLVRQGLPGGDPLWKPIDPRELAARVRESLDAPPGREAATA
jgi:PAS domain S-box-containing protein